MFLLKELLLSYYSIGSSIAPPGSSRRLRSPHIEMALSRGPLSQSGTFSFIINGLGWDRGGTKPFWACPGLAGRDNWDKGGTELF